ncbi:hypothetical protein C8F04DRAFT_1189384 [Mycena alexandri]|uniref:Uncharacterized protein n=1 Tax=Mycena alexandri TaxID=1745969 RepID=A0AAD6WW82_9AGAR|nr:hypothetical protein C8F04DRAFT_1189384 [Mycena alexandri]
MILFTIAGSRSNQSCFAFHRTKRWYHRPGKVEKNPALKFTHHLPHSIVGISGLTDPKMSVIGKFRMRPTVGSAVEYIGPVKAMDISVARTPINYVFRVNSLRFFTVQKMPAHKTRAKSADIVNDHKTGNDQLICNRANRYKDGPGENYIVLRQLWVDYFQRKAGKITTAELRSRTEVKFGESGNMKRRRTQYRRCGSKYRLVWYASYTTPEQALVHDELTELSARAQHIKCSGNHIHREWYCWNAVGGFSSVEGAFLHWMGRRGHMTTNVTYY